VTVPDNPVPVDYELRRPKVAEVIVENLLFVVHNDRKLDTHFGYGITELHYILLIFRSRRVNSDDD
jgi:hypothetical protein